MVVADTTFLDVFWWMIVMFFWVMAIWLFVVLIGDVIRRDDLSGWAKAAWVTFMLRSQGVLNDKEYEDLKRKTLALA